MSYQKTKKYPFFSIVCILFFGCTFLLNFSGVVKAASMGNCDQTTMSASEYENCIENETCAADEYRDAEGDCVKYSTDTGYYNESQGNANTGATNGAAGSYNYPASYQAVSSSGAGWDPGSLAQSGLPSGSVYLIIRNVLNWLLIIFSLLAIIGFAISGIMYILSAGSDETMQKAKKAMTYSIIGIIVGLSGLVIIYAIDKMLRGYTYF